MPDKIIEIPNVGRIAFPDTMKPEEIEAAASKLYRDANAGHPPADTSHSWLKTAVDWLPAAEGAIGGIVGGMGGSVLGAGVGGVPGAIGGAAVGGAMGEAHRQLINRALGNAAPATSGQAASGIAKQAAVQGGSEAAGMGATALAARGAKTLMTSALKPAYAMTDKAIKRVELPRVVKTLLEEGVNVTQAGIGKINGLLKATNDELADIIHSSKASVFPESVAARGEEVAAKLGNQVAPAADVAASRGVTDEFMAAHGGAPNLPAKPIPVQRAQELKKGTYQAIGARAYGESKGAVTETEKALARGLKEGIEAAHPNVKGLNAREGALIEAKDAIAKRVAMAANRDPGGIGWIAENPKSFMAFVLARSPGVKSMLARGLYQSAAHASRVPENLIRLGVSALAQSDEN